MSIESYNENQEQAPKLTEEQKEDMYSRCKQKAESVMGYLNTIASKNMSDNSKGSAIKNLKELFNEGAHIMVGHDMMSIDSFCDKLKNGEIDFQDLKQLNTMTMFNEGQFIKENIPDGTTIWLRKIKYMSFRPRIEGREKTNRFYGLDDIKPESVKEKEQQTFQGIMKKSTAMYNDHEKSRKNDEKDATTILNSIT